jgi:uncharacterized membrane protein
MSHLIAIAYPDEAAARRARSNLADGVEKGLLEVDDVVVIAYDQDGRIVPLLSGWTVGLAAAGGAVAGGLIGLILLGPLLGMAAGGAVAGRAAWKKTFGEGHISESFVADLWEGLTPGSAAMVVLVRDMTPGKVLPHIREPGRAIHTSLSAEVETQLDAALAAAKPLQP